MLPAVPRKIAVALAAIPLFLGLGAVKIAEKSAFWLEVPRLAADHYPFFAALAVAALGAAICIYLRARNVSISDGFELAACVVPWVAASISRAWEIGVASASIADFGGNYNHRADLASGVLRDAEQMLTIGLLVAAALLAGCALARAITGASRSGVRARSVLVAVLPSLIFIAWSVVLVRKGDPAAIGFLAVSLIGAAAVVLAANDDARAMVALMSIGAFALVCVACVPVAEASTLAVLSSFRSDPLDISYALVEATRGAEGADITALLGYLLCAAAVAILTVAAAFRRRMWPQAKRLATLGLVAMIPLTAHWFAGRFCGELARVGDQLPWTEGVFQPAQVRSLQFVDPGEIDAIISFKGKLLDGHDCGVDFFKKVLEAKREPVLSIAFDASTNSAVMTRCLNAAWQAGAQAVAFAGVGSSGPWDELSVSPLPLSSHLWRRFYVSQVVYFPSAIDLEAADVARTTVDASARITITGGSTGDAVIGWLSDMGKSLEDHSFDDATKQVVAISLESKAQAWSLTQTLAFLESRPTRHYVPALALHRE